MSYPVWDIPMLGGPLLIAVVAIIHVYVAHFAIGGGLFLALTEHLGHREKNPAILSFVERAARLFLLVSMVFGAITGVGIWLTISTVQPAGTSLLIHTFVFGWAIEWVFFACEIAALFVYVRTFGKLEPRLHVRVGIIYFVFAWLSLFVINGIVTFMLTPGAWLEDGGFASGFFNPTMWPSLVLRTLLCVMIAGLFGFFSAARLKDAKLATRLSRYSAKWMLVPLALTIPAGYWYLTALPPAPRAMVGGGSPEIPILVHGLALAAPMLLIGGLLMAARLPARARKIVAVVLLLAGLLYMGSFEWIREAARRPWVIPGYIYSNGLTPNDITQMNRSGALRSWPWTGSVDPADREAGHELFRLQCQACHTVNGLRNDVVPLTVGLRADHLSWKIASLDNGGYMPPFGGTIEERRALARYIDELSPSPDERERDAGKHLEIPEVATGNVFESSHAVFAWRDDGQVRHLAVERGKSPTGVEAEVSIEPLKGFRGFTEVVLKVKDLEVGRAVLPPERTNFDCLGCHGTLERLVALHDRLEGTDVRNRNPALPATCESCHDDLGRRVHTAHKPMAAPEGDGGCERCHTGTKGTPFLRGHHVEEAGLGCASCHGDMSRLTGERAAGRDMPDCLSCHENFGAPTADTVEDADEASEAPRFGAREDDAGLRCVLCHGEAHGLYPAAGSMDRMAPLRLQGEDGPIGWNGNCKVCHTEPVAEAIHHPGITAPETAGDAGDAGVDE